MEKLPENKNWAGTRIVESPQENDKNYYWVRVKSEPNKTLFKDINKQRNSDNELITNKLETVFNFSPIEKITFKNLINLLKRV